MLFYIIFKGVTEREKLVGHILIKGGHMLIK